MKSAGKARNNGLYRHIRTSKEIIRNLLNDSHKLTKGTGSLHSLSGPQGLLWKTSAQELPNFAPGD